MPSLRRKGRRFGPKRMLVRIAFKLVRPLAPGLIAAAAASYFLDGAAGGARRQKAISMVTSIKP